MKTKQTIYKTAGGCYNVGNHYFQYLDGALKEATKEECMLNQEDQDTEDTVYRVDSEDFVNAVLDVWYEDVDEDANQIYRVDVDDLLGALNDAMRRQ